MKLIVAAAVILLTIPGLAQTKSKSDVFGASGIKAKLAIVEQTAKVSGSGGAKLGDYGNHSIALSFAARERRSRGSCPLRRHLSGHGG